MNKLQQIEEFQNDIIDNLFNGGTYGLAEALYNAGYRKLPEDSVVLSREELKRLETNYKIGLGKSQSWCKSLKNRIEELEKENFKLKVDNEVLKEEKEQFENDVCNYEMNLQHLPRELENKSKETAEKIFEIMNKTVMLMAKYIQNNEEDCCKVCAKSKACNENFKNNHDYEPDFNKCYIHIAEYFQNEADKK